MSVDLPVTVWRTQDGLNEMGSDGEADVTTLSGLQITTLGGLGLITLDGTATPLPATEWAEDDSV